MESALKSFSESISTGKFEEIKLTMGSSKWNKLLTKIKKWKQEGGILQARLKGKLEPIVLSIEKEIIEKRGWIQDIEEARQNFRDKTHEEKAKELEWIQWQADAEREQHGVPLSEEKLEGEWNDFELYWKKVFDPEIPIDPTQEFPKGWTPYAEHNIIPQGEFYHKDVGWY